MPAPGMIEIPIEDYNELVSRDAWLSCLESAGVDSWGGYEFAQEMMEEMDG